MALEREPLFYLRYFNALQAHFGEYEKKQGENLRNRKVAIIFATERFLKVKQLAV